MAISYVGGATGFSIDNADVSVDLTALTGGSGTAALEGDLVIFAFNIADADNVDLTLVCNTADFVSVTDLFGNGTQDANLAVFYKFMTATPDTAVVGEGSTGGNDTSKLAAAMVFRGVKTVANGGPFDVAAVTATGTTGGLPDPPSIDTSGTAGIWTVIIGANAHTGGAGGVFGAPLNYVTDFLSEGAANDTADGIIGMGYRSNPGDPENPGAFSDNVSGTGWCAVTLALSEAAAVAYNLPVDSGTFTLAGTAAGLKVGRKLIIGGGTFTLTGGSATGRRTFVTLAGGGSYVLTGTAATLTYTPAGYLLVVDPGSYALTGGAAVLQADRSLIAASGGYTITGTAATLQLDRILASGAGVYALTGSAITPLLARNIPAGAGVYALTGTAAATRHAKVLILGPGDYVLTGAGVLLTWSGAGSGGGDYMIIRSGSHYTVIL